MDDRELLELAAKAAGIELKWHHSGECAYARRNGEYWAVWNPLTDDGDALRLSVKLGIQLGPNLASKEPMCFAWLPHCGVAAKYETHGDDACAATRRAIVRVAAEIGGRK